MFKSAEQDTNSLQEELLPPLRPGDPATDKLLGGWLTKIELAPDGCNEALPVEEVTQIYGYSEFSNVDDALCYRLHAQTLVPRKLRSVQPVTVAGIDQDFFPPSPLIQVQRNRDGSSMQIGHLELASGMLFKSNQSEPVFAVDSDWDGHEGVTMARLSSDSALRTADFSAGGSAKILLGLQLRCALTLPFPSGDEIKGLVEVDSDAPLAQYLLGYVGAADRTRTETDTPWIRTRLRIVLGSGSGTVTMVRALSLPSRREVIEKLN